MSRKQNSSDKARSSFSEQDYLLVNSAPESTAQTLSQIFLRHQRDAETLLESYNNGDDAAVALFKERHPDSAKPDFKPTLVDARLLVSRDSFHLQDLTMERLKREAKRLLKLIKNGEDEGVYRLHANHPKWEQIKNIKLADAQWVIARELGLPSWPRLKHHLQALGEAKKLLQQKRRVIDDDAHTLHIRCGTDIQESLAACGIKGAFQEIIDPFPQGRVPPSAPLDNFVKIRAKFVDSAYSRMSEDDSPGDSVPLFSAEEQFLKSLPRDYQSICLWYEHDCFDQLSLAYVLHHLAGANLSGVKVELVQVNQFPGINRFVGIGQLSQSPAALALLWQNRVAVTPAMMAFATKCWRAFTEKSPAELFQQATLENAPLPVMQSALKRLLQELPWKSDGLSLTERLILEILDRDGAMKPAKAFHFLMAEAEPQAYLGDIMFLHIVLELTQAERPPVILEVLDPDAKPLVREKMVLTETGKELLRGEIHWRECGPTPRWLGNTQVYCDEGKRTENWSWCNDVGTVLLS